MPELVVRMWEELDARDADRVLEIGTGTGYSTALGCHRLGDRNITSIEVDPTVARRAAVALERVGYRPHLAIGDGLTGWPDEAPYDRVIATCAVRNIPVAWVEQCRPDAVILAPLSGWLDTTGLAKLTVTAPGRAEGTFVDPDIGFMSARSDAVEFLVIPRLDQDGTSERPAEFGPEVLTQDGPVLRIVQLAAPRGQYASFGGVQDLPEHLFVESDESYVTFRRDRSARSGWSVRQGGRRAAWDDVERAIDRWTQSGSPPLSAFRITITADRQTIGFGSNTWDLP